ncbi:MAG: hypothetical protein ACYCYI_04755 [Saccharofermentanales bacterium]
MPMTFFSVLIVIYILISLIFWMVYYNPIRIIKNSLMSTTVALKKELSINGNPAFFMQSGFQMFRSGKLTVVWNEYLSSFYVRKSMFQYSNINEFFSEENIIGRMVNTGISSSLPMVLFIIGAIMGAMYSLYYGYRTLLSEQIILRTAALVLFAGLVSLTMFVYNKNLMYQTRRHIREFAKWISIQNNEIPSLNEQLGDLRHTMHSYQQEQMKFFARLPDHISETTQKALQPFLEDTKSAIENFISASTDRQIEAMEHLAEYFVANTTTLYSEQIEKLTANTEEISQIQIQTAETLKSVSTIYTESKECIQVIADASSNTLLRYDSYLEKVDSMNTALVSSVKQLDDLVEFVRINSQNQNFTIENLSKFQQDLIDVSARSTNAMQSFFADFNDQFTSSIIALHAASTDMIKSGELLKGSYSEMAENINVDVNKVFAAFEENLATISVHLSETIIDLQDAIDELPEILRRIKVE